jgi:hypothetical protein
MRIIATLTTLVLAAGCAGKTDPPRGEITSHQACEDSHGTVYSKGQWGGKYNTWTYWCVNSDKRITGIWFHK